MLMFPLITGIDDPTRHLPPEAEPEYVKSLQDKMNSTPGLVQAFVALSSQSHGGPSNEDILKRCQEVESEVRGRASVTCVFMTETQSSALPSGLNCH